MSAAATAVSVLAVLGIALALGLLLAIWLPMWAAGALAVTMAVDETRRFWRRWRAVRRWAARLSG